MTEYVYVCKRCGAPVELLPRPGQPSWVHAYGVDLLKTCQRTPEVELVKEKSE